MHTIKTLQNQLSALRHSLTTADGDTSPELREAIEARAARQAGGRRPAPDESIIADQLNAYLDDLSAQPHAITDEDIAQLKAYGYSEDAIFEITVSAAVGEGLARLERTLDLLEGTTPCD